MAALRRLQKALAVIGCSQADLARHLQVSQGTVSLICKRGQWPSTTGMKARLRAAIAGYLIDAGLPPDDARRAVGYRAPGASRSNGTHPAAAQAAISGPQPTQSTSESEDFSMLLRKHRLNAQALRHFKIGRDPFTDEMRSEDDVFVTPDIREVRGALRMTAKHGGFLAVVSESGGGKSTLVQDMAEWVRANNEPITVISPYVLGMGRQDRQSRPLLADDIIRAIFRIVAPTGTVPRTAEARAAKLHALLAESARLGRRHVLLIEEAHDLSTQTLKHLKRFYELRDGFQTLLAIILIGQTELEQRLSEQDASVREVVQRMAIVHLPAIDNHIADYLRHKFARVDLDYAHFITPDAIDEIRNRLRTSATRGSGVQRQVSTVSLCHPLVINNLVSAAMNEAVKIGAPKVTGALIAAVARAE